MDVRVQAGQNCQVIVKTKFRFKPRNRKEANNCPAVTCGRLRHSLELAAHLIEMNERLIDYALACTDLRGRHGRVRAVTAFTAASIVGKYCW